MEPAMVYQRSVRFLIQVTIDYILGFGLAPHGPLHQSEAYDLS